MSGPVGYRSEPSTFPGPPASPWQAPAPSPGWVPGVPPARRGKRALRIASVLVFLVLGGFRIWLAVTHGAASSSDVRVASNSQGGGLTVAACAASVPAGASAAAFAYVDAVNASLAGRIGLDTTLAAEGGVVHRNDLLTEATLDQQFVSALRTITFPSQTQKDASALMRTVGAYLDLMSRSYAQHGYLAAHAGLDASLDNQRAQEAAQLRNDLGIPASGCVFRRP